MTEIEQLYSTIDAGFPWGALAIGVLAALICLVLARLLHTGFFIILAAVSFIGISWIIPIVQQNNAYNALEEALEENILENYQVHEATVIVPNPAWKTDHLEYDTGNEHTHYAHVILESDVVVDDMEILYRAEHDIVVFLQNADNHVAIEPVEGSNAETYLEQQNRDGHDTESTEPVPLDAS